MKLSIALPVHGTSFAETLAVARAAEQAGFDGVWVPDHLVNIGRPTAGVLECWTVLSAVAAATARVFVGSLVIATPLRQPPLLAKQAATLDAIAPGRVVLGLGPGGFTYDAACKQFGIAPLAPRDRVAHVEETIACLRRLFDEDPARFEGRFARAIDTRLYPRPAHPLPIVVAARAPRMLHLAAEAADGWNCPFPIDLEAGLAALARHGRRRETIEVSVYVVAVPGRSDEEARQAITRAGPAVQLFGDIERHHLWGGAARLRDGLREFARRGADHLVLDIRGVPVIEGIQMLGELNHQDTKNTKGG